MYKNELSHEISRVHEYRKWTKEIPFIEFPKKYKIKIIPPFGGAIVRFIIKNNKNEVSVYLDCYNNVGYWDGPYWEIYPNKDSEEERYDMNDIEGLLKGIELSLKSKKKDKIK
jgi:hypothetical protein